MKPLATVSIVIPTFNVGPYIEATLKSVVAQTQAADEVIVVDNGSSDGTLDILRRFPFKVLSEAEKGAGACRNRGIREASGDWVAFLDGDDQFFPEKIKRLKEAIAANPLAVIIAHDEVEGPLAGPFIEKKLHLYFDAARPALPQLYERCFLSTSTVAVKRDVLTALGGFNEAFIISQDYELWMRVLERGQLVFIPEMLALYLLRPASNSDNVLMRHQFVMQIIERYRNRVSGRIYAKRAVKMYAVTLISLWEKKKFGTIVSLVSELTKNLPRLLRHSLNGSAG